MRILIVRNWWWLVGGAVITALFLPPLFLPDYRALVETLIKTYPYAAPFAVIISRFVCVVIAPLPGVPVTFASMALLPWWQAALYNFIGTTSGAITAFLIARNYREPVVARFTSLKEIHAWQERTSRHRQFWAFVGFRFSTLMAFDIVSYVAGLTKMPFRTFLLAVLIIDIPVDLVFFYFGGIAFRYGIYIFLLFGVVFLAAIFVMKYMHSSIVDRA